MTAPVPDTPPLGKRIEQRLDVLIVLMLLVAVGLAYSLFGPSRHGKWQYAIVAPADPVIESELNRLGAEGWEIVGSRRATSGSGYSAMAAYELILKRPGSAPAAQTAQSPREGDPNIAAMKADLRNLVTAEESYFADHVTYTTNLGSGFQASAGVTVTVNRATGTGWSASASHNGTSKTCQIYVGAAVIAGQEEGVPTCR
jgi:hypothetical protein